MVARLLVAAGLLLAASTALAQDEHAQEAAPSAMPVAEASEALENMLVLDIRAVGMVDPDRARVLTDLLVSNLRATLKYKVMGSADLVSIIGVDQQKQLTGCDDDSCMAEVAGALDAPWLVTGNLGLLGQNHVLTLKILDAKQAALKNQLSEPLPDDEDDLPRSMEVIAYSLVGLKAPELPAWYTKWWVWTIVGGVVIAGVTTALAITLQPSTQVGNLGQVTF